jgi:ankyrin repeat protein
MMAGVDGHLEWMEGVTDTRMKTFLMSSSKGLAESITGWEGTPQFIHESVREYLIDQGGLEEICGDHESLTSIAHEQLKHCCLRGMAFDMSEHFKQRGSQEELYTEDQRYSLRAKYPFAEYATTYVLHHANQAAVEVCQQHFRAYEIRNSKWTRRFNFFQKSKLSVYSGSPSLRYLCAERNLARLMARPANALSLDEQQRYGTPLIAAIVHSSWEVLRLFLTDMGVPDVDQTVAEVESKSKFVLLPRSLLSIPWRWAVINDLEHLSRHLLTFVSEKHSDEALRIASYGGHEKVVQMLIERGSDVKGAPLLKALEGGHTNIAQMLIDAGAGTGANDAALLKALEGGYEGIAQMLIDAGAGVDDAVLLKAIERGYVKVVQMLINGGAGVKGASLLEALELGHEDIAQMLIDAGAGANDIALLKASERGYGKLVKMLIDTGADVNTRGESHITALHAAFANGHEKIMRTLIDAGAGVNQEGEDYRSVLHEASRIGHEKVVQMLIDAGADVNQGEDCRSALQEALEGGHGKVVQVLIDAGADANARGKGGASALHTASLGGHEQIVRILIDAGADVDAQEGGRLGSALKAASGSGYEGVVKMLIDAGADVNAQGGRYGNALQAAISGVRGEENVKGIVEMLIDAGADVNALGLDFTGSYSTALQSASDRGYGKVVQILKNAGAAGRSD